MIDQKYIKYMPSGEPPFGDDEWILIVMVIVVALAGCWVFSPWLLHYACMYSPLKMPQSMCGGL